MELIESPGALRVRLRQEIRSGREIGLVPTMGYLHEGHVSLIQRARQENDLVIVSIFVNPLQFGANEDLSRYPRDLDRDRQLAQAAGADVIFTPGTDTMYPSGYSTRVEVQGPAEGLEGASRPGHFGGVATVVLKLLNLTTPHRAYFGEKDWQQLAVIRRVVRDLNVDTRIIGCPTVREDSGLALSSRNSYLTPEQRQRAAVIARALTAAQHAHATGAHRASDILGAARDVLSTEPELTLDYLDLIDENLRPLDAIENARNARLVIAARLFGVRLIDNMPLNPTQEEHQ